SVAAAPGANPGCVRRSLTIGRIRMAARLLSSPEGRLSLAPRPELASAMRSGARMSLKAAVVDASPKLGDNSSREGYREEQPEEVLGAPRLRRCARPAAQLVRRGPQGEVAPTAGRQGPVRQREHLWQQPRRVQR